ncbi:Hopanoid C-2 methylase [Ensifer psoraleae]|nr:Hopanoid C-2 methylase [Sinorhizobium psoraleae]
MRPARSGSRRTGYRLRKGVFVPAPQIALRNERICVVLPCGKALLGFAIASNAKDTTLSHVSEAEGRRFQLILIKPSHYDDDGYVIRWWRAMIPSNSLAALYGIAADCAERKVLGPDVSIDITVIDETNTRIDFPALLRMFSRHDNFGLVALVGVQSNQFPRALDIARPFRAAGIPVALGGFHVSGCLAMLDSKAVELDACREMGISMFAGEAEGRLDAVLRDAATGRLAPIYNFINDLPGLDGTPVPFLPKENVAHTFGLSTSFDAGRGCPYQCSFCTIINVQGRKSRFRSADDIEKLVRMNWAQGVHKFFITDDNFARNKEWEAIFDRLIELREKDGIPLGLMIQVDTLCHKIPNFIEKAKRAGVTRVFIGLENVNPDNLAAAKKHQNKITEYRKMLLAWKAQGIMTLAGYISAFRRIRPRPSGATSPSSNTNCRSTSSSSSSSRRCRARRTIRSCGRAASRWRPTSTSMMSSMCARRIRG